jgi:hypothetical protein
VPTSRATTREPDEVQRVVARHAVDVQRCYEPVALRNHRVRPRIDFVLTISAEGAVHEVQDVTASPDNDVRRVAECLAAKIKKWRFDSRPGRAVRATCPIVVDIRGF